MKVKILEVRDEGTHIPMLCVDANLDGSLGSQEKAYYLRRVGYPLTGKPNIIITHLDASGTPASNDPFFWKNRTFKVAHHYIIGNWMSLKDGDVVDVQFILGETAEPKVSERLTAPMAGF